MRAFSTALAALALALAAVAASAQQDLEPGVQTSSAAAPTGSPANASSGGGARASATPATATGKTRDAPATSAAAGSIAASGTNAAGPKAATPRVAPKAGKDRIELDTTQISGNRELPKVMYVVPWRKADPGEFTGRPLNSLLDEALTPVDRDVFRRQNRYYSALQGQPGSARSQPGADGDGAATPTPKDEK